MAGKALMVVGQFQSTLSVRRATRQGRDRAVGHGISIHALREESDQRRRSAAG